MPGSWRLRSLQREWWLLWGEPPWAGVLPRSRCAQREGSLEGSFLPEDPAASSAPCPPAVHRLRLAPLCWYQGRGRGGRFQPVPPSSRAPGAPRPPRHALGAALAEPTAAAPLQERRSLQGSPLRRTPGTPRVSLGTPGLYLRGPLTPPAGRRLLCPERLLGGRREREEGGRRGRRGREEEGGEEEGEREEEERSRRG